MHGGERASSPTRHQRGDASSGSHSHHHPHHHGHHLQHHHGAPSDVDRRRHLVFALVLVGCCVRLLSAAGNAAPIDTEAQEWERSFPSESVNCRAVESEVLSVDVRLQDLRKSLANASRSVRHLRRTRDRWYAALRSGDDVGAGDVEALATGGEVALGQVVASLSMGDGEMDDAAREELRDQWLEQHAASPLGQVGHILHYMTTELSPFVDKLMSYVISWRFKVPLMFAAESRQRVKDAVRAYDEAHVDSNARRHGTLLNREELSTTDVPGPPLQLPPHPLDHARDVSNADSIDEPGSGRDGATKRKRGVVAEAGGNVTTGGRRDAVVDAIRQSWRSYRDFAWGFDELKPVSRRGANWHVNGTLMLTAVDALTTLHLAGLHEERDAALQGVVERVEAMASLDADVSQFEASIRLVGSLTSAYELTGKREALQAAQAIADRVSLAYAGSRWGLPYTTVNFRHGNATNPEFRMGCTATAEVGSVQLEMRSIALATGNETYDTLATRAFQHLRRQLPPNRLAPTYVNVTDGTWCGSDISLGSLGDSYYEYLLKQFLVSNRTEPGFLDLFRATVQSVIDTLVVRAGSSPKADGGRGTSRHREARTFLAKGDITDESSSSKIVTLERTMEHLACFFPGTLALGSREVRRQAQQGGGEEQSFSDFGSMVNDWMAVASELTETCVEMYLRQASGVSPETVDFPEGEADFVNGEPYYVLRPETMESLFYMWRTTREQKYRDWGWQIFRRWNSTCRVSMPQRRKKVRSGASASFAFSGVHHVNVKEARFDDTMQSFWLAESLKYALLLFSDDDALSLDEWVLNTEAHPLRMDSQKKSKTFGL